MEKTVEIYVYENGKFNKKVYSTSDWEEQEIFDALFYTIEDRKVFYFADAESAQTAHKILRDNWGSLDDEYYYGIDILNFPFKEGVKYIHYNGEGMPLDKAYAHARAYADNLQKLKEECQ